MLGNSLHIKNRLKLVKNLPKNSICIFESNDQMPTNADGLMPFRQNNDLLYLTGIDQEETSLVIFPDAKSDEYKEILFIKKTSEEIAVWEGHKLSIKEAQNILEDKFDALLFFIDTQTAHGHEHDIQTLIRTCATKNVPFALNTSTARIVIDGLKQTLPK